MDCLVNLLGLAPKIEPYGQPAEGVNVTASTSGRYLSELEGLQIKASPDVPGDSNFWAPMDRARTIAIKDLPNDFYTQLKTRHAERLVTYAGLLGESQYRVQHNSGLRNGLIEVDIHNRQNLEGVTMLLKKVGLVVNHTGPVDVTLSSNVLPFDPVTWTVQCVSGRASYFTPAEPLRLPMLTDPEGYYRFSYTAGDWSPCDNSFLCGCSGKDTLKKQYISEYTLRNPAKGLTLEVELRCAGEPLLCQNLAASTPFHNVAARALQYLTGYHFYSQIVLNDQISYYTTLDGAGVKAQMEYCKTQYNARIEWLVDPDNLVTAFSDCFRCQPRMFVAPILV